MRPREYLYMLGLKPNFRFFPTRIESIGTYEGKEVFFYQWMRPKSKLISINPDEIAELKEFINEGDFAIDVGAHIGDSTLPIALACGKTGTVLAFEPNFVTFSVLSKNASLNSDLTNIIPLPFACTENTASLDFSYSDPWLSNGGDKENQSWKHGHAFNIPVDGIDPATIVTEKYGNISSRLKFIKIDAEGFDYDVLKQLSSLIDITRPFIKFEIAKFTTEVNRNNLWAFFKNRRYELIVINDSECRSKTGSYKTGSLQGRYAKKEDFFHGITLDIFAKPIIE